MIIKYRVATLKPGSLYFSKTDEIFENLIFSANNAYSQLSKMVCYNSVAQKLKVPELYICSPLDT